jgi:hypothetical protein
VLGRLLRRLFTLRSLRCGRAGCCASLVSSARPNRGQHAIRPNSLPIDQSYFQAQYDRSIACPVPPGFSYQNGTLAPISYAVGDTFVYKGKTRTVSQGVLDAQNNALSVQSLFNNQTWQKAKTGCHQ